MTSVPAHGEHLSIFSMREVRYERAQPAAFQTFRACEPLDMLEYHSLSFISYGRKMGEVRSYLIDYEVGKEDNPVLEADKKYLSKHTNELVDLCKALDLPVSSDLIEKRRKNKSIPEDVKSYDLLIDCIYSELKSQVVYCVPKEKLKYRQSHELLSYDTRSAFPLAYQAISAAGNCYSVDQDTACVFHCMRALESGLRALAADVGVTWTVLQWHVVINEIEKAIKSLGNTLPAGQEKSERMQFLSEAAKEFAWFKDGWRNYAAHARVSYDSGQALKVLEHVCAFFEVISRHLQE